jgi:hypothetical protein
MPRRSHGSDALDPRRLFAAIAHAVKAAEADATERAGEAVPVAAILAQRYGRGRANAVIAEASGGRYSEGEVQAIMARAHRVIRARLEAGGWLERDAEGGGDGEA